MTSLPRVRPGAVGEIAQADGHPLAAPDQGFPSEVQALILVRVGRKAGYGDKLASQ